MDTILKTMLTWLPFLDQYPAWVRMAVVVWILFTAAMAIVFIMAPRNPIIPHASEPSLPTSGNSRTDVEEAPQGSETTSATTPAPATTKYGPDLDDVLATLKNDKLTALQKSQFVRRHTGQTVRWEGIVLSVKRAYENIDDSDIYVVFRPPGSELHFSREIIVSTFPATAEADLAPLSEGDRVVIQGTLQFIDSADDHSPSLKDCSLISFSKAQ